MMDWINIEYWFFGYNIGYEWIVDILCILYGVVFCIDVIKKIN